MSGLQNDERSTKNYLSIVGGKLARRVKEGTAGAVRREQLDKSGTPTGKVVYEIYYDKLGARLIKAEIETTEWKSKNLRLTFSHIGEQFIVTIPMASRYLDSFMARIPNLNLNEEFTIRPYSFENDQKKRVSGIEIKQNEKKIESYYTRENPNGFPEYPEGGNARQLDTWKLNVSYFWEDRIADLIKLLSESPLNASVKEEPEKADEDLIDDLPF